MKLKNYILRRNFKKLISLIVFFIVLFWPIINFNFFEFNEGLARIGSLFVRMYPLDISFLPSLTEPILDTLFMAFFATVLGVATTIVILPMLSNILFDIKVIPKIISAVFSILRTVPALIFAAILVSLFSVGNFSGFLSLYIISVLMASKIIKEYTEEIDKKYIDTYLSTGFSRLRIYRIAVLENIRPQIISVFFLVLESNIRGASVLGLVGAGGIGQLLWKELNHLRYDRVALIIIILVMLIFTIDLISLFFRNMGKVATLTERKYFFRKRSRMLLALFLIGTSIYYCYNFLSINSERFLLGFAQTKKMLISFLQPDFTYLPKVFLAMSDSLLIAFFATIFASATAIITSYLAARNLVGKTCSFFMKIFINILRTFPPIIVAIIFFRGFGPGYVSSFFALYMYTLGIVTKMYSEVLENVNSNVLYSVDSMGIHKFIAYIKIIFSGYFPEFLSICLYRFEMNIKNSTILGMVGAGGIGQLLINNIEFRFWHRVAIILLVLCITIILLENLSYYIREKIKR